MFPLLLICGMYSVMLRRLWRQAPGGHAASAESIRNKKRVIRMVLIVIVIFALSWLPIQVVLVLRYEQSFWGTKYGKVRMPGSHAVSAESILTRNGLFGWF